MFLLVCQCSLTEAKDRGLIGERATGKGASSMYSQRIWKKSVTSSQLRSNKKKKAKGKESTGEEYIWRKRVGNVRKERQVCRGGGLGEKKYCWDLNGNFSNVKTMTVLIFDNESLHMLKRTPESYFTFKSSQLQIHWTFSDNLKWLHLEDCHRWAFFAYK